MSKWFRDNTRVLVLVGIWLALLVGQILTPEGTLNKVFADHSGAFAALWVLILADRFLPERAGQKDKD